jgi:hypothetical protein
MRLDAPQAERAGRRCRHFPWWTLWLLWPLLAGLKWIVPLWLGAVTAIAGALGGHIAVIAAVLLIAAGALLIGKTHSTDRTD